MTKLKTKQFKNQRGKGIYQKFVNLITDNENKLNDGEYHAILYNRKNNSLSAGKYIGPGTNLIKRLRSENHQPITLSDKVAQAHDTRYTLAKNYEDIKKADQKMVDKLNYLQKNNLDSKWNILPAKYGIKANQFIAKILPEKLSKMFVKKMTNYGEDQIGNKEDKELLENKLKELELEGYGKKNKNKKKPLKKTKKKKIIK